LFLCYTGADKSWTRNLAGLIEQHRMWNRQLKVFFDEWDLNYGLNIINEIDQGLKSSRYVGLVLSPAMLEAPWPTVEWQSQIMDDPSGKSGRILPLLLKRFHEDGAPIELPFVLKPLKRFDFTDPRRFQVELDHLIRRLTNQPLPRGPVRARALGSALLGQHEPGQEAPEQTEEALTSNLLPVLRIPESLFSDFTTASTKHEIWSRVAGTTPPFFLYGGRLYSFVQPNATDNIFKPFVSGRQAKVEPTTVWLSDHDNAKQIVGLFNNSLRRHGRDLSIWTAKSDRSLFYPPVFCMT